MKLHNSTQNEAILSNVGEIGEFRIRNSAKAFNILSSGLYANKIRAIIRELSCNAVDSHVASGKPSVPFDVHLPTHLEPWFSVRDYGLGLSHEQVTNIYTTYFESTKTESNEFIGALGLGSKSPFSYTDNFTVTAIKDGRKGIYTAFINDQGVPSIALMMEEQTTDPNGVEVRFAVDSRMDFDKFKMEARHVYEYFSLRPVINGEFAFKDPKYSEKDIIKGVHTLGDSHNSYAIMGNIKYPIEVPNAEKVLGNLHLLLDCGLVMEFDIGELDFQASREGLSYIPATIDSIKAKLETLNSQLAVTVAEEANKIDNMWERLAYLVQRKDRNKMWVSAVAKYVQDTKFEMYDPLDRWNSVKNFSLDTQDLAHKYNISLKVFSKTKGSVTCTHIKPHATHQPATVGQTQPTVKFTWHVAPVKRTIFVVNDTKVGAFERTKYHWRHTEMDEYDNTVYVIEPNDKTKKVLLDEFFASIKNPPVKQILRASQLKQKPSERTYAMGKNVTILKLVEGDRQSRYDRPLVWRDAGTADEFSENETHYYLPLSGYKNLGVVSDVKVLSNYLIRTGVFTDTIHGVRKADIEWVKTQKNWVNLDEHIKDKLNKIDMTNVMGLVKQAIDWSDLYRYNAEKHVVNPASPYIKLYNEFKDVRAIDENKRGTLLWLCNAYGVNTKTIIDPKALIAKYKEEVDAVNKRYPLLEHVTRYSVEAKDVAEYINLIDTAKGV